jgi:hypothetical protein
LLGEHIIEPDRSRQFESSNLETGSELIKNLKFVWMPNDRNNISQAITDMTKECVICLDPLFETEVVRLSCHSEHVFHFECIERCLMT